jgi:hypothetical protein
MDSVSSKRCYDYFYRQAQALAVAEVQTFVLSARTPRATVLHDFGYTPTGQPGVYASTQSILKPIGLVVLNELTSAPHNAFVQCFASRREVRIAAFRTRKPAARRSSVNRFGNMWLVYGTS